MAKVQVNDPSVPLSPAQKNEPKLQMIKQMQEARFAQMGAQITIEALAQAFNAGYEARKEEEK